MGDAFQPFCPPSIHAFIPLQPSFTFLSCPPPAPPPSYNPRSQPGSKLLLGPLVGSCRTQHPAGSQCLSRAIHPRMGPSTQGWNHPAGGHLLVILITAL